MSEIEFRHGIFDIGGTWYRDGYFSKDKDKKRIMHKIPKEFEIELAGEYCWKPFSHVPFTIGYEPDMKIYALAICNYKDNFSRKIGRKIVSNRIKRAIKVLTGEAIEEKIAKDKEPTKRDREIPHLVYIEE